MLYLTESDVRELLPIEAAIDLVESAFHRLATGEAINHPRRRLILPTGSTLHYMPGADGAYFGIKV
jgi:ornithine cyclodeaminase/alanine dehydrogenase-like protein (mu-crystallin family)